MNKKEQLLSMRREHLRERMEVKDNEWFIREGEDARIQAIRDKMTRTLHDAEITGEKRKKILSNFNEEIEKILDERDEREHDFIELELKRHQMEQELELEIEAEEAKLKEPPLGNSINNVFLARSTLTAGAEQMRKTIEEKRRKLSEEEQFSTIMISNSERDNIPDFTNLQPRRKKRKEHEQAVKIDTIVIKQREIGMMYRESQELQESQLSKPKQTKPKEIEEAEVFEEAEAQELYEEFEEIDEDEDFDEDL